MKQLLLAVMLASGISCTIEGDVPQQRPVHTVVYPESLNSMPSDTRDLQYMAWASAEGRTLSDWCDSRSEAESKGHEYEREHSGRDIIILWRQKPGSEPWIPKHPKG